MRNGPSKVPSFLSAALEERSSIVHLTVLHVPDDLLTRAALGPARLEELAKTRLAVASGDGIAAALGALEDAEVRESHGELDARWGLIFENAKGQRVLSVYVDKFGQRGSIEGHDVALHGRRLIEWLEGLLAAP